MKTSQSPIDPNEFGQLLVKLRQARGMTQKSLANWAGITAEHLCRIESGDRQPPRRLVVERIVSGLRLSPSEKNRLLEAAGLSAFGTGFGFDSDMREAVEGLLERAAAGTGKAVGKASKLPALPIAALDQLNPMIRGTASTLEAAITLLRVAAGAAPRTDAPIQVTFFGLMYLLDLEPHFHDWWDSAIQGVLEQGWNLQHLWLIEEDSSYSLSLVTNILQFLGFPGRYEPHVIQKSSMQPSFCTELLIVPGVGALLFMATTQEAYPDGALLIRDEPALEMLTDHLRFSLGRAKPLLSVYPATEGEGHGRFNADLTSDEEKPGDRLLVKDGLSALLIPAEIWFARIKEALVKNGAGKADLALYERIRDGRERRQKAFLAQTGSFRFYDICTKSAIQHFARYGKSPEDKWTTFEPDNVRPYTPEERLKILKGLIDRLKDYEHYVLALLDGRRDDIARVYWEIKGEHVTFLETWQPAKRKTDDDSMAKEEMLLAIRETTVVKAFRAYFMELWEHLPPRSRDNKTVIRWLEGQCKWIQERTDGKEALR